MQTGEGGPSFVLLWAAQRLIQPSQPLRKAALATEQACSWGITKGDEMVGCGCLPSIETGTRGKCFEGNLSRLTWGYGSMGGRGPWKVCVQ